jgi:pimeloyl-ACP methyl ester carboxylesterase
VVGDLRGHKTCYMMEATAQQGDIIAMYCQLETIREDASNTRSPIVFVHGFPDSPLMFEAFYNEDEQAQPWLQGRNIYTIAFPNRHTNRDFPSAIEMAQGVLQPEFAQLIEGRMAQSPTGKIIPIMHDWGSIYTWRFIRQSKTQGIQAIVAMSVGSSLRFDIWEHGIYALGWYYSVLFCLPYYIRLGIFKRLLAYLVTSFAGYRSETAHELYLDAYHYWDGPIKLVIAPLQLVGLLNYKPSFVDWDFPVLFMRSEADRMASNRAFEAKVQAREDSHFRLFKRSHHWFMHHKEAEVRDEIRAFLAEMG